MPVNKDAMARFRIIDRLLADPIRDYRTEDILNIVNRQCPNVTLRMIQKDIRTLQDDFGKELVRNARGRGTVKYADQSQPLFSQKLSDEEEELLREVLRSLGQFDGLDNFKWLDSLRRKLDVDNIGNRAIISFSKNDGLQVPSNLLGKLFSAISRKKVIRFEYTVFNRSPKIYTVYPYQLKQFNDRWFLLCTPIVGDEFPFDKNFIANFALDRMAPDFEYIDDIPFIDTSVDLKSRFDEIIGVTLYQDNPIEDVYFAVHPNSVNYVMTKYLHITQIQLDEESSAVFKSKYPSLADWTFFSIECRPNYELFSRLASYGQNIVLVEPTYMRTQMEKMLRDAAENYSIIQ